MSINFTPDIRQVVPRRFAQDAVASVLRESWSKWGEIACVECTERLDAKGIDWDIYKHFKTTPIHAQLLMHAFLQRLQKLNEQPHFRDIPHIHFLPMVTFHKMVSRQSPFSEKLKLLLRAEYKCGPTGPLEYFDSLLRPEQREELRQLFLNRQARNPRAKRNRKFPWGKLPQPGSANGVAAPFWGDAMAIVVGDLATRYPKLKPIARLYAAMDIICMSCPIPWSTAIANPKVRERFRSRYNYAAVIGTPTFSYSFLTIKNPPESPQLP